MRCKRGSVVFSTSSLLKLVGGTELTGNVAQSQTVRVVHETIESDEQEAVCAMSGPEDVQRALDELSIDILRVSGDTTRTKAMVLTVDLPTPRGPTKRVQLPSSSATVRCKVFRTSRS